MATFSEISNANNYKGESGIGAATLGAVELDTKPLQYLAAYTVEANKADFLQRQKDAEAAAKELADLSAYDLTSSIPKDAKHLTDRFEEVMDYVRKNNDVLNYNKDKKGWIEYKKMTSDLRNDITAGQVRDTMYKLRQKEIQDETNPAEKERMQKELDEEISKTDIRTVLKHSNKFDVEPVKYTAPKETSFTVSKEFANIIAQTDVVMTDMADVNNQANAVITGLSKFLNPQTELEQQQFESQKNTGKLEPVLSAQNMSAVMPKYIKNNIFDSDAAKKSGNLMLSGLVSNVEAFNRKMETTVNAIRNGAFKDKLSGGGVAFGVNGINENDYHKIDLNKGYITPEEYAKLNIMGIAAPTIKSKTEIKQTDNAIQKENLAQGWAKLRQDDEQFKLGLGSKSEDNLIGAQSVLTQVADAIKSGTPIMKSFASGKPHQVYEIADANLLREFATIDKDGNVTNTADKVVFDPAANKLYLTYYKRNYIPKKDDKGKEIEGAGAGIITEIQKTASGKNIIEREVPMNAAEWFGQITKRKNPNKDIGGINNIVTKVFSAYGNDLKDFAEKYGTGTTQNQEQQTGSSSSSVSVSGRTQTQAPVYKKQDLKNNGWTDEQIKIAVKAGKIKVN